MSWISDLICKEYKRFIIEAYIVNHEYSVSPEIKEELESIKEPIVRSLQKKYFYIETDSKIRNKRIVKKIFENVVKNYQLEIIAYKISSARSDIELKGLSSIKNMGLEPPK